MIRKICHIIVLVCLCFGFCAKAQHVSQNGTFQVDVVKGCEDATTVTVTILTGSCGGGAGSGCEVYYEGLAGPHHSLVNPADYEHRYTEPGVYTLTIYMGAAPDNIQIEILPNPAPQFEVYLCDGNRITLSITDRNYNEYVALYSDGSQATIDETTGYTHQPAATGLTSVTVRGRYDNAEDNCNSVTRNFTTVGAILKPVIPLLQVVDASTLQLDFTIQPDVQYRLEVAVNSAASFQVYRTLYNTATITLPNLRPDDNYYCFRLVGFDPCTGDREVSDIICSANLDLSVQNNVNRVTWATNTTTAGFTELSLTRATQGNSLTEIVAGASHADTDVTCGTEYCYQLTNVYSFGRSISLQKCGTAFSTNTPAVVENITAVVGDPGVHLQWQTVPGFTPDAFSILKSTGGSPFTAFTTTNTPEVRDETYLTETATCYKISYIDVCGNTSPLSSESCPIRLEGALQRDNAIRLTWSAYSGWKNGVNDYVLEKYSASGELLETLTPGTTLEVFDPTQDDFANQTYRYVVKANAVQPGLPQAESNAIIVTKSANIFYPTAFTPNADNLNDLFSVFGQYVVEFEMNIFNRWGELVYTATALEQGWDGTFRGNPMPEGTYTFVAEITDRAGRTSKKSGSVLLLRKK